MRIALMFSVFLREPALTFAKAVKRVKWLNDCDRGFFLVSKLTVNSAPGYLHSDL
jgi:hypothetical protein